MVPCCCTWWSIAWGPWDRYTQVRRPRVPRTLPCCPRSEGSFFVKNNWSVFSGLFLGKEVPKVPGCQKGGYSKAKTGHWALTSKVITQDWVSKGYHAILYSHIQSTSYTRFNTKGFSLPLTKSEARLQDFKTHKPQIWRCCPARRYHCAWKPHLSYIDCYWV